MTVRIAMVSLALIVLVGSCTWFGKSDHTAAKGTGRQQRNVVRSK